MKPVIVFDLFCGMGGFSQGALNAGAEVAIAIDFWEEAVKVHRHNHPNIPVWRMELGHESHWIRIKAEVDLWKLKGYHVHIHGSPPCQALSVASKHDASEGMPLVLWFLDLVKKCEPDSWSMENVVPVRKRLPEGTPSVILNSADFGVAQTRRRCYAGEGWVAQPTHSKEEWLGVIDVLPHLTELMGYAPPQSMTEHFKHKTIDAPYPTVTSKSVAQLRLKLNTAGGGSSSSRRVNSQDSPIEGPSKTIHNNTPSIRTDEPTKIRSLTIPETLIIQGFSPNYDLSPARTQKSRWTMIGNAVPPPVAEAVIKGITQHTFPKVATAIIEGEENSDYSR